MWKRKRIPKPRASTLALAKICGCGRCKYCDALSTELTMQAMEDEVRRGKEIAEEARKEFLDKLTGVNK
jgi:hypothetical protein